MASANRMRKELDSLIEDFADSTKKISAMLEMARVLAELSENEEASDEEDSVPTPRKPRAKVQDDEPEDDEDENNEDDEDNSDDEPEDDEEPEVKPSKKNTSKKTTAAKTSSKKVAPKVEKKAAVVKATDADYSEMNISELHEYADKIFLEYKKSTKAAELAKTLKQIDAYAKKNTSKVPGLVAKAKVEVTQPRGRTDDVKKARVMLAHLVNAGKAPF